MKEPNLYTDITGNQPPNCDEVTHHTENYVDDSTTNYRFSILNSSDNFLSNTIGLRMGRKNRFGAVLSYKNEQGDSKNSDSYQLQINWNF